jgi:hypothetical protein
MIPQMLNLSLLMFSTDKSASGLYATHMVAKSLFSSGQLADLQELIVSSAISCVQNQLSNQSINIIFFL